MDVQTQILQNIHQEMINGSFSDIQVFCKDGATNGSRLVLAALSPYFRAMLTSDIAESRTGAVKLPSVSQSVFQDILKMYFCKMNLVDEDNCMQILDAAEMMQLDPIKESCKIYLNQSLVMTTETCLTWWRTLRLYHFLDLSQRAFTCLTDNLADFVKTEHVIHLSKGELLEIISKDDLKCKEDDILKAAMKWIEHNNPDADDVQVIFHNVRLDIVDRRFLVNEVVFTNIVIENNVVRKMIQQVICSSLPQITSTTRFLAKGPRVFISHHNGRSLLSCFTSDEKWEDVPPAPVNPGWGYSTTSLDNKIYVTGGFKQHKCTLVYDIIRKVWNRGPGLNCRHWSHGSATASSKVYAISGELTCAIEEKTEREEKWKVVGNLGLCREHAFSVTVGEDILVMGGYITARSSDLIQCFNTRTRTVTKLDTRLPCSTDSLRGSVHLPDVYLVDTDGNVMHIQVTDVNGKIHIENKLVVKRKPFQCNFGIVHIHGNLLCFTEDRISKFNLAEGTEEESTFAKPQRSGKVHNALLV
ncbi:kelch-like protein 2 [Gigantopelta aegis]|uniref:kelch-like protein 2 n=1 Tax=Gigantopelta aegis TaxID=1735272 RepID=UPI001B88AF7B|nr:kelch-like protein 2 [Gigantopelta aegis]